MGNYNKLSPEDKYKTNIEMIHLILSGMKQEDVAEKTGAVVRTVKSVWRDFCVDRYSEQLRPKEAIAEEKRRREAAESCREWAKQELRALIDKQKALNTMPDGQLNRTWEQKNILRQELDKINSHKQAIREKLADTYAAVKIDFSYLKPAPSTTRLKLLTPQEEATLWEHFIYDETKWLWSLEDMISYVNKEFGKSITDRGIKLYLERIGLNMSPPRITKPSRPESA